MIELIDRELVRVRLEIAALQAEEQELETARAVLGRLGGQAAAVPDEAELSLDFGTFTSAPPSGSSELAVVGTCTSATASASDPLSNVGALDVRAIDVFSHSDGSRECRPVDESGEPSAAEPLVEAQPEAKVIPAGIRKVRPYCQQPDACPAPSRGPCRICHAKPKAESAPARDASETADAVERAAAIAPVAAPSGSAPPAGAALAAEVDALIAERGLSKKRVALHLFNNANGLNVLAKSNPRRATVEKVRALLADPPIEELRSRAPIGDNRFKDDSPRSPKPPPARAEYGSEAHRAKIKQSFNRSAADEAERRLNGEKVAGVESPAVRAAKQQILDRRAAEERQTNPVEAAKLALQRKGLVVHSAIVTGGRKDRFIVSGQQRELTPAELIDLAERKTGQSFRRAA